MKLYRTLCKVLAFLVYRQKLEEQALVVSGCRPLSNLRSNCNLIPSLNLSFLTRRGNTPRRWTL